MCQKFGGDSEAGYKNGEGKKIINQQRFCGHVTYGGYLVLYVQN